MNNDTGRPPGPLGARVSVGSLRAAGEAIPGRHGDRLEEGRRAQSPAVTLPGHDYDEQSPGRLRQLPAWWFVLTGKDVPDDAPRDPPPPGFEQTMTRIRKANALREEAAAELASAQGRQRWRDASVGGGEGWDPLGLAEIDGRADPPRQEHDDHDPDPAPAVAGGGEVAVRGGDAVRPDRPGRATRGRPRGPAPRRRAAARGGPDPDPSVLAGDAQLPGRPDPADPGPFHVRDLGYAPALPPGPPAPAPWCRRKCGYRAGSPGCRTTHGEA